MPESVMHYLSLRSRNLMTAIPSIMLAAELPKNLLLGFSVPSIRILRAGAMKK
jgi:hypothetical protein